MADTINNGASPGSEPGGFPADTVIIGAGLAGLFTALKLAENGRAATVVSPSQLGKAASSAWAQGGIAAAVGLGDTAEAHARDTIAVGGGLVDAPIAVEIVREAANRIRDLLSYGVPFDRDLEGHFVLSREAAHSEARVVRVSGDRAGHAIMQALVDTVRKTPAIRLLEGYAAEAIAREAASGSWSVELRSIADPDNCFRLSNCGSIVLATGGIGGLYRVTTNPDVAVGAGIAMAARVGATIIDAEFVQFHPTAIDVEMTPAPLASEALRGEGAVLVDGGGARFMANRHPDGELAPRDVVARAVFDQLSSGRGAYLDCREAFGASFKDRFPTVYAKCTEAGIDPAAQPIPVTPAEHYHMGGVKTDPNGRTSVSGLWAVGEVGSTGLHGANRLASNSLLEAVVVGARAALDITNSVPSSAPSIVPLEALGAQPVRLEARAVARASIQAVMSKEAGVVRDGEGLRHALTELRKIQGSADGDLVIENMAITARFVAEAALRRKESRGAHFRSDFPDLDESRQSRASITLTGLDLRDQIAARNVLTEIMNAGDTD